MKHTECKDCELRNGDCGHHFKSEIYSKMGVTTNYDIASLSACDQYGNCEFFKSKAKPKGDLEYKQMDERLMKIADHYGLDSQLNMLQEECAELIQAVNKYKRIQSPAIVEEIADVYIMLAQIVYLLNKKITSVDVEEYIVLWMEKKIRRQLKRLEGEQNADHSD